VHVRWAKEGVDDWDKSASFVAGAFRRRSTSSLGDTAVRKRDVAYEPAFGGIVSVLAGALLYFVLFTSWRTKGSYTGTAVLAIMCVRVIGWGVGQIVGDRKAKRIPDHDLQQAPLLGTAVSCVLVGLLLAPVTLMLYEFAPNHPSYAYSTAGVTILLLSVGAVVGIRQGVWR
jgi:hypothetical protein